MMDLQVGRYSFRTKPSFINGKVVTRLNTHDVIVFDEEVHSALDSAIWAVSGHHTINHAIRAPATMRRVVEMRTVHVDDLIQMFDSTHLVLHLSVNPEKRSQLLPVSWH